MPCVTKIEAQKRNPDRWSIYIDGRFFAGCAAEILPTLNLKVGIELEPERLEEIRDALGLAKIRDAALRHLGRRNRSEKEMREYLRRKEFAAEQVDSTIGWLKERGYLNDAQFAEDWIKNRQQLAPRGKRRLQMELYQKGVARDVVSHAISDNVAPEPEAESAYRLILSRKNRWRGLEPLEIRRKIYNFLSYRGFSPDAVEEAWRRFEREELGGS